MGSKNKKTLGQKQKTGKALARHIIFFLFCLT